jgi:hypothetical protein
MRPSRAARGRESHETGPAARRRRRRGHRPIIGFVRRLRARRTVDTFPVRRRRAPFRAEREGGPGLRRRRDGDGVGWCGRNGIGGGSTAALFARPGRLLWSGRDLGRGRIQVDRTGADGRQCAEPERCGKEDNAEQEAPSLRGVIAVRFAGAFPRHARHSTDRPARGQPIPSESSVRIPSKTAAPLHRAGSNSLVRHLGGPLPWGVVRTSQTIARPMRRQRRPGVAVRLVRALSLVSIAWSCSSPLSLSTSPGEASVSTALPGPPPGPGNAPRNPASGDAGSVGAAGTASLPVLAVRTSSTAHDEFGRAASEHRDQVDRPPRVRS